MSATDEVVQCADLGTLDYIAEGGQGKVFRCMELRLPDVPAGLAYKEYRPGQVRSSGLEALVGLRSRMHAADRARLDGWAAWPVRLVKDGGKMTGILMPLIADDFVEVGTSIRSGLSFRKEREIQYLFLAPDRCASLGFPLVNLFQRYAICRDFASALAFLAEHKVVFGDINAKNTLFLAGPGKGDGRIMLVDCDAARKIGTDSAVQQLNSPDWFPPKDEQGSLTVATDVYKFALFVIRCLSPGAQASTASDPRRLDNLLDPEGRILLRASLGDRKARPGAAAWAAYFTELTQRRAGGSAPRGRATPQTPASTQTAALGPKPAQPTHGGWVRQPDGTWSEAG